MMQNPATVFLMYHELGLPTRALSQAAPRYQRYVIPAQDFEKQMTAIRDAGMRGVNVTDALRFRGSTVAITFDDGCETDVLAAAPVLSNLGFGATFYVIAGFVGTPHYMTAAQLRELSQSGFEIGCHSMTHTSMAGQDDSALRREIADSKFELEQILGTAVEHFSCPGGEYDERAVEFAHNAGYRSMAGSMPRPNLPGADVFQLGRVPIKRGLELTDFVNVCRGNGLTKLSLQFRLQEAVRQMLGPQSYYRLRETILGEGATHCFETFESSCK